MPPTEDAPLPERIGGYRILRLLGKGGMGAVFEAEQDNPRRTVALKVVNAGVLTDDLRRRFELEAQVLGHLHHPCIAQIYEAGMYESSGGAQPFFAMELIHGTPLLDHVTKRDLPTRKRLELIARICDGIQHAHQRGVIHRDLKPANILVDEEGQPKILDFGLARATDADLQASTLHTDIGQIMGTIPYMSPEQAAGDPSALDLRSDIYSLGVVAYRVLSGEMPYAAGGAQVLEALRVVQEEDARPLSSVNRSLRGDVDTIVGKALEKEPARRYPSASEFAADIRHFLNDEPITARPPSAIYQLRKFARRNKALVLGIAAVFIALLIGLFGTSRGFVKASAEAERANRSSDFFETILLGVNPAVAQGKDTELLRIILDETAERIDVELADYPTTKADIHSTMALAYFAISAYEAAAEHSRIAHELFTREKGPRHPDTILEERSIGTFLVRMGDYEQAEEIFASNLALSREVFGPDDARTHNLHAELAALYLELQRADEAADLYELVHSYRQREFGDDDSSTIIALNGLGLARLKQNRYEEAEALLREALETRRRVSGESHPETIKLTHNLAGVLSEQGRIDEAIQLYRDALERNREILGPDHDVTLGGQQNLAGALRDLGRFDEAAQLQLGVLESRYALLGREDPRTYTAEHKLALIYHKQRRDAEAEPLARHANQGLTATYGEEHTSTLDSLSNLMNVLTRTGQLDEADAIRARLLDLCVRVYGEEHSETLVVLNDLAVYHANAGRYAEAEPLARDALEKRRRVLGDDRVGTLQSLFTLATVCDKQGRHAEAVPLLAEFLVGWARIHGDGDAYAQRAASVMGENLGRFADLGPFESEVRTLTDYHRRALPPEAPELVQDLIHRGAVLTSLEQYGTAEEILLGASGEATRPGEKSQAARRLAQLYEATGDSAEAETWRARVDD